MRINSCFFNGNRGCTNKKSMNSHRNFPLNRRIDRRRRYPWSTRWHEIYESPSPSAGSIRIQLSSFRNNCYRFPTAMLHFQVFTSTSFPSLFYRSSPPLDPSILHALFTPSSLNILSLSLLSLFLCLPSQPTLPPTHPLSFSTLFRPDNASFAHDCPSSSAFPRRETSTQTLSQACIYKYTVNVPLVAFIAVLLQPEDFFLCAILFQTPRPSHRYAPSLSPVSGCKRYEKEREKDSHVHVSTDTRPKSPRWKSLLSSSYSRIRITWPPQWRN